MLKGISNFVKVGLAVSVISLIAGCNGIPKLTSSDNAVGYKPVYSGFPLPYVFVASSVQWNEDYAVSAKHNVLVSNVVYSCSTGCDLIFIKRKALGQIPEWRNSKPYEKVTSYGNSPFYLTVKGEGSMLLTKFRQETELNNIKTSELYQLTSAATVMGMSGGPVYGEDGKVLGITLGYVIKSLMSEEKLSQTPELMKYNKVTYIMPTEIIEREWKLFQAKELKLSNKK